MAVGIVNRLEMVDVHHANTQRAAAFGALAFPLQQRHQMPAAVRSRQGVVVCQRFYPVERDFELVIGKSQPPTQCADISADVGKPQQYRGEETHAEKFVIQVCRHTIGPYRNADGEGKESGEEQRHRDQLPPRQAKHAEHECDRVEQHQILTRFARVHLHDGNRQPGRHHHWDGQAGIGHAQVKPAAQARIEPCHEYRNDSRETAESCIGQEMQPSPNPCHSHHHRRCGARHQQAAYAHRLHRIILRYQ